MKELIKKSLEVLNEDNPTVTPFDINKFLDSFDEDKDVESYYDSITKQIVIKIKTK